MPILGSHLSVAGGLHKAIAEAVRLEMDTVQIFTKNNNQWAAKPLTEEQIDQWRSAWKGSGLVSPMAHASYLINLAAPDDGLWRKSIDALAIELQRANALGLAGVVVHPGAFTTSCEEVGIQRVIEGVKETLAQADPGSARLLLENTAGQGSCLGRLIPELATMLEGIDEPKRVGICFDTCHAFAAGYDITTDDGMRRLMSEIDDLLPEHALVAVHVNDSKCVCGKRVDRHEHIGLGHIGDQGFRNLFAEPRFRDLPMYLETPKEKHEETGEDWDTVNLRRLRKLAEEVGD